MSYTYKYPRPAVTVDAVLYHLKDGQLYILLIKREKEPFAGQWALPGGFMDIDEAPEVAVKRELAEEAGVEANKLVQIGAFGAPGRDPRHRTISIAYLSLLSGALPEVKAADDAADGRWFPMNKLPENLAFDHDHIITQSLIHLDMQLCTAVPGSEEAFLLSEDELREVLQQIS